MCNKIFVDQYPHKRSSKQLYNNLSAAPRSSSNKVNDHRLPEDSLVIGLKGKEKEIKTVGMFFWLMPWHLREYFITPEYLIKTYYVPLFHGLTMADDLTSVTKKIMDSSVGHRHDHYNHWVRQSFRLRKVEQPSKERSNKPGVSCNGSVLRNV